ncbi:lysozyme inhibitor LprI family protein [Solibacillus isronensis]|uniref:lysozyme inhibitor LprI family protein n=1 Tax=Solibacillus isronensis TaxID=412383 RepID=UPI00203E8340|nr:lysozyme inhibitor LprI family protein [Solibacillus isronensis]MCM3722838.1 DUF1311 domain-containing protein [Solibacillus isronensis]
MKKLVGMFTACLLLAGCGALTLIEENSLADEETKVLSAQLQEFNEVKEAKSQADWDRVLEKAHSLLENPALDNNLKKELEGMVVEAETEINKSIRESFEQNSANGDEEGNPPPGEPEDPSVSLKEKYLAKLADVEKSVKEFDEIFDQIFDQGIQVEMTAAEGEIFSKWDMLLNEIYADLKKTLPPNDMSKLREEQRDWLEYRDEKATEDALQYKGGSMETLQYESTQAQLTKERCYQLVDLYMK